MKTYVYHLIALFTVGIWGTTFVSTKVLLNHGLSPVDIIFYRFLLAYLCLWPVSYRRFWAKSLKDELLLMGGALTGGSLYFLTENKALTMSYASNVSLIVCTAPLLTAIVIRLFYKKYRLSTQFVIGSFVALSGVAIIVFNGHFVLNLNPLGDLLSFSAALLWAFYSLIIKKLNGKYSTAFITRKIFFYGIISLLPIYTYQPLYWSRNLLFDPVIMGNLLFLGVVASMLYDVECRTEKSGYGKGIKLYIFQSRHDFTGFFHRFRRGFDDGFYHGCHVGIGWCLYCRSSYNAGVGVEEYKRVICRFSIHIGSGISKEPKIRRK